MDRKNVEDLYPLSPLQQGMLFHTLYSPGSGAYVEQTVLVLAGRPRAAELRRAWERVTERHPILRTGFVWEGVPRPLQVVFRKVDLPFVTEDWSGLPAEEREARWERFMADDRARGFDLLRAPLMRFALIRTAPGEHRLVWTSHHILTDGWSLPLVLNDFAALYDGLLRGAPPRLRPVRPFREYIAWLNRQDAAAAERYWRARLADWESPTPLPLDRAPARAGQPARDHAMQELLLPPDAVAALDEAARRMRVTASAILQGAWATVLAQMTAADDVVFGTTVSGRPPELPGVQEMVGMFINTIPVRVRVDDDAEVGDWLRGIHRQHAAAGEFEHAPLADVQKWAGARADAGLFETLLVYENYPIPMGGDDDDDGPQPDGALEIVGMEGTERTDLPLSLAVAPAPGGMRLSATHDQGRLHADDARRILAGLSEVVGQITGGAAARVAELSPFTEDERRRPLARWSGRVAPPVRETIPSLFRAAASASPDAVAVRAEDATLTYARLDAAANRLAHHLRALGVAADGRVGVSMERSSRLVVALLGILKAGAAYVPLDPTYPPERLDYMRRDSGTELVLVDGDAPAWAADARVVSLAADAAEIGAHSAADPGLAYDPEALSYVMYTSGSTGTPKGVAVPHRAVVRLVRGADFARFGADETFLLLAPVAFDASTFEIWGALLNGGTLAVHPPEVPDPARLGAFLRARGVTTLWFSAGLFHQVADADPGALRGVRQVLAGGDTVSPAHVRRVLDACPGLRVIDGYGPTENTTFTACHTVRDEDLERGVIPVGRPVAGTQAYVLDARMRPLPAGVPGELYAGGTGLARGYLGRPALTAQSFVPDPFGGVPGARLYRTGDRVRWLDDGTLEFGGRLDQQLKIRGFRIEPGEIEAALRAHPHVGDAVVDGRADGAGGRRLVAYVIPRDGVAPSAAEMREALAGRLPAHMVPSAFVVLDALPLTPNGKVDRRALPEPETEAGAGPAPRTPTEEVLAGLWTEVLGVQAPSRDDDFFQLGGHSLIATRLASRIRQAFAAEVPLRAVFEAPTLAAMAQRVDDALRGEAGRGLPPVTPVGGNDLPLTFSQERLWFFERLEPGNSVYNIPFPTRLVGALDVDALRRALGEIVRRHQALRTSFLEVDGRPVQRVHPPQDIALPVDDLSMLAEDAREAELLRRLEAWTLLPYDLARDPLLRASLLRLADDEHVLMAAMHHIVSDGWSMGVFWRELAALYEAFAAGRPSPLPPLALQYGDVAVWQRRYLDGEAVQRQAEWWRARMEGAPALLELPTDRPRPAIQSYRGALLPVVVPAQLAEGARGVARGQGATLFMALVAAWSALLGRWAGQDDVVVGMPIAGRTQRETEELIGLFVNTLPIRAPLDGDPSFRALLARVREATLGAYAHQDLPYDRLVEELRPGRSLAHSSLYQVMLAFNNTTGGEALELAGLRLEGVDEAGGVARLDLTLSLAPAPDGALHGTLEYATDLFDAATAARMVRHLATLLAAAVAQPDAPLSSLPLLGDDERAGLAVWNATDRGYAPGLVHHAIERRAMRMPDAVALTFEGAHVTYADLDRRATHLAHRLRRAGVGPEARVGLMLERSPEMVISILAVLKAGAAYVPLDPGYPAERLAYMLADARVAVLLTHSTLAHLAGDYAGPVLWLDAPEDDVRSEAQAIPYSLFPIPSFPAPSPDGLAYVIYTSGSTGRPKGAMNAHRGVWNRVVWMQDEYGLDASDVVLQKTPFSFDVSVWEFLWPLMAGARMVLARPGAHGDPAYLAGLIRAEGVTTLHFVPSMLQAFLEAPSLAERCASVRRVMASGEALPADLVARFHARMPSSAALHNLYGPTEAAVDVTYWPCAADDARGSIPIGRPVANTRIHVLDRRGAPAPVGVPGELHIAGVQVGRGYLDRPALTAEKFVPDPFSTDAGARMYRTGDLARWLADGTLEYRGRMDHQVKVRGFRIELGEIEAALAAHPAVREAVVLARRDRPGDPRLVGYVVPSGGSVDVDALRAGLRGRLPEYMVPSAFVVMEDGFPLTPSGKADRRALPAPDAAEGAGFVAPRTPTEQVLAVLWAGLLGVERVGAADEFFDLGGHSLLATRVVSAVRESFGVELPVRALFEHPVLHALAAEVDRALRADGAAEAPPIVPVARGAGLPLSFAQERLWFVDRLEPGSPVYHMPLHYRLTGSLDADALRRALAEVVRRHESLRTSLPFTGEQPVQRIAASVDVDLPIHDLRHLADEAERDAAAQRWIDEVSNRAFDLERGPLFRAALVRVADDEHLLIITLHHVIADGWSIGVLWSELSALYTAFVEEHPSPLPELPVQYGDFSQWQRAWLVGDELERQLAYWRRRLAGAPPLLELPTDRPRPAVQTYVGAEAAIHLDGADAEAIRALGRREGSTLFMVLLAAMNVVFSRLSGQDDVVIGTPIAGRTRAETEGMIGLFLNSLALRTDLGGEPTFRQLLRRVREATLEAYAHQDLPFERILEELAPERSLSHSPLFQVMLNLANFGEGDVSLPGIEVQGIVTDAALASKFDLTVYAAEGPDAIGLYLVYNTALFDADRARIMLAQIVGILRQAAEDAEQPIARLSLLTDDAVPILPDPTAALSTEWRGSVPEIFAAHAARTPHALAVEDPQERWTYADLDADTTRLAQRLISDGVQPGDVVAILGHRSAALVRALLGTMKAGAAFLILDPAYPPARLAEYVRIARPTGFLPLAAAGDVPSEVADALRETVVSTLPLDIRRVVFVDKTASSADSHQPPPAVLGEVASLSEPEGAPARGLKSSEADLAPPVEIGPDSLAYLSFTSGTTGRPKAVMGRHGSLTHFTPWLAERFELGASDRFSLLSGLAHDPLHRDVFTPLQSGASVIAPIADKVAEPGYLARWMRDAEITVAHLTPAMGQLLTDVGAPTAGGSGLSDAPRNQPATQPPPAVLGEVGEWSEPGGGARAGLSEAARSRPGTQPPPAVLGEVASLGEPVGAPAAGTASSEARRAEGPTVDSLRRAFFVGDVLTRTDVARMHRLAPNLTVINYYGSTETQRAVAHFVVPRDLSDLAKDIIPVGTGLPDVQVLIRNAAGERVGIGEVGEMWMRSPHVALGYLGDPELTAARFVANPWTGDAADPAYRTGDLGRYRPDGVAEIAGRADQQVKIRGFRIEPGEIEAALRAHSAIRDTVVVARGDADARRLVAYVVAEGGDAERDAPTSDALREWLRGSVPDYMVPSAWVFLPALPVTPNGKVDRKALPEPEADAGRPFVAPRTSTESALAEIWAALMNVGRAGAEDDFFALGGHSLLATRLVARVRDRFGVELPLRTLFEAPVLAALAAQIDQRAGLKRGPEAPPLVHVPHDGTASASFAQERLWFVDRMEGGGAIYHIPTAQLLAGPVDPGAMRRAIEEVVRRHETLRTALPEVDGVPVQRISPPGRVEVPFIDLSMLADEERDAEATRLAEQSANEPFDLENGPLFRASLVRLTPEGEHLLLVNLHHAIGDGWSMRVLLGEISTLHAAFLRGEPSPLPPLPIQYADYAAWQRAWLSGPVLDAQLSYWREALAAAPPLLHLPTDRPRPPVQGHRGASEALFLEPAEAARVLALARGEGATLFMVLLAALDVVLARWSGQHDVVVGAPVAGRTRSELEGLIGLFLNSLALRTDLSGDPSFRALLGRVRQATLQAYAHQDLPFERILEDLRPERSQAHTPVFQVMLNLLNYGDGGSAAPEGEMTSLGAGAQLASKFDITLYAAETDGGIGLHAVYDADLFDPERMREMLAQLAGVLRQAAAQPDRALTAFSLRTRAAASVLPDPSVPIEPEAWRGAVHERFAAVAAATPDAPALRDPRGTWTYAQVDAAANRVAHRLAEAGVQAGEIVAVLAHRSAPLVPALLGAWKAGAAFLVLDPAYPPARLAEYVRIAAPRALVRVPAAGHVPAEVADALASSSLATIDVKEAPEAAEDTEDAIATPAVLVNPDDLAYVAFTSGTTGQPKAIAGTHRPLPHFFGWYAAEFGLGAADRFSMLSGLAHDPLLRDVFAPLLAGGTLVIPDPEQIGTPGYLAHWMRAEAVTVAHLTPAMGQLLTGVIEDAELFGAAESQPGTQPPPAVLGEVGEWSEPGGGARAELFGAAKSQPGTQPPPAVLGEVGEWSEPGGGARAGLSEAARFQPGTQPPPAVLGEVGEWSEPGGGARAGLSEAARFQPGTQPPPAVLGEVGEWSEPGGGARADLSEAAPALRLACFGGETLRAHDVRRLRAFAPGVRIANFYGATETPQAMAAFVVPEDAGDLPAAIPVGRGIGGVDLLVLAADGSVAGVGEVGEIVIRTPYLSRGYLNDDSLTAARFVINPATGDPRDRAYRTGDLGRYRPDGTVEVAGRADAQVKLRGFRIEPGEVESALRAHPAVRDAAVVPHGEETARKLVAYLVGSGAPPGDEQLREMMRGRLPDYMVPAAFVWLDALPLTPNGKLDRRALPDPQAPAEAGYVAPRTTTEEVLANAWAALLRVERVGATDDFFALGGHSLLATRVAARVRDAFGVELPLRAVFQWPTLAALAADIDARRRAAGGAAPAASAEGWLQPVEPGSTVHRFQSGKDAAGGRTPFFCVHPAGGTVLPYAELAHLIAPDRPLYALQAVGVFGEAEPLATVDEMAGRYLTDVRRVQPHGPYVLGGWSAGGIIALEMAARLRAAGEAVATVALFDTRPPDFGQQRRVMDSAELYRGYVESLVPVDEDALSALESALRALPEGERLPHLSRWMAARDASVEAGEVERIGAAVRVFQLTSAATRRHHVRPYAGRADLFRVPEGTAGEGMQSSGLPETWRALGLSALRVHAVPGTHVTMVLPPHVHPLAAALRPALVAAESREADAVER